MRHLAPSIEQLEPRRLFAAARVTTEVTSEGLLIVTGTNRSEEIRVVEHFPGIHLYDVMADGALIDQVSAMAVRVDGRGGRDTLYASTGDSQVTLIGGNGSDTLTAAGTGQARLEGGSGNDMLAGSTANDILIGGGGRDALDGAGGDDYLDAGPGNDVLTGGDGVDVLLGGGGRDALDAGAGDDTLAGGAGRDRVTGGAGADLFASIDREREATDFLPGEDRRTAEEV
jgi:Ca2+-binding RTX toxin-like protein